MQATRCKYFTSGNQSPVSLNGKEILLKYRIISMSHKRPKESTNWTSADGSYLIFTIEGLHASNKLQWNVFNVGSGTTAPQSSADLGAQKSFFCIMLFLGQMLMNKSWFTRIFKKSLAFLVILVL